MADNVTVSNSSASVNPDYVVWTDQVTDPVTSNSVQKQLVGIVDATADGTTRAAVGANGLAVSAVIASGNGTFYAEDAASAGGESMRIAGVVRQDSLASNTSADGDYTYLKVSAAGALYVTGGTAATQYVEDTASSGGENLTLAGVIRQDTLASSTSATGDYANLKSNANGELYVTTSGSVTISGTMPITVSSQYVEDAASAGGESLVLSGVVRQDTLASSTSTDGDYAYLKVNAAGSLYVAQTTPVQAGTATLANVAGSASSVTLQASNTARKGLVIVNDSTAILYVKFGSAASATSYTYLLGGSVSGIPYTLELPAMTYTGIVTGIWASATGNARVTELT